MSKLKSIGAFGFVFFSVVALMAAEETYEETFRLKKGGNLEVRIAVGSIEVETWNRDQVAFSATVSGKSSFVDSFQFSFEENPGAVSIIGEYPKRNRGFWDGKKKVKVTLSIPESSSVRLKTSGGNISLQDLIGDADLKTSGGNLTIQNLDGQLIAKTSGGNIRVGSVAGNAQVNTSGGHIYLDQIEGDLDARTSGGNIYLESVTGEVTAKTSGGNIKLTINNPFQGLYASTSGGTITCYMEEDLNADLYARTSGGSVTVDFPVTVQGKVSRSKIEGKVNDGGPEMNLRTSGGNIKVLKAK